MSNLRRALEPERRPRIPATVLVTEAPGYALRVPSDCLDAVRFDDQASAGRQALDDGDVSGALTTLDRALAMWRDDAFADFTYEPFATATIARLHERAPRPRRTASR